MYWDRHKRKAKKSIYKNNEEEEKSIMGTHLENAWHLYWDDMDTWMIYSYKTASSYMYTLVFVF